MTPGGPKAPSSRLRLSRAKRPLDLRNRSQNFPWWPCPVPPDRRGIGNHVTLPEIDEHFPALQDWVRRGFPQILRAGAEATRPGTPSRETSAILTCHLSLAGALD